MLISVVSWIVLVTILLVASTKVDKSGREWKETLKTLVIYSFAAFIFYSCQGIVAGAVEKSLSGFGLVDNDYVKTGLIWIMAFCFWVMLNRYFIKPDSMLKKILLVFATVVFATFSSIVYVYSFAALAECSFIFMFEAFIMVVVILTVYWKGRLKNDIGVITGYFLLNTVIVMTIYSVYGINVLAHANQLHGGLIASIASSNLLLFLFAVLWDKGKIWYKRTGYKILFPILICFYLWNLLFTCLGFFGYINAYEWANTGQLNTVRHYLLQKKLENVGESIITPTAKTTIANPANATEEELTIAEKQLTALSEKIEKTVAKAPGLKTTFNSTKMDKLKTAFASFIPSFESSPPPPPKVWKQVGETKTFAGKGIGDDNDQKFDVKTLRSGIDYKIGQMITFKGKNVEIWYNRKWNKTSNGKFSYTVKYTKSGNRIPTRAPKGEIFTVIVKELK